VRGDYTESTGSRRRYTPAPQVDYPPSPAWPATGCAAIKECNRWKM